jgi:hypothetical protein
MQRFRTIPFLAGVLLCLLVAVCPVWGQTQQTFILSNEGTNGLITRLVTAGYGNYNIYNVLLAIQENTNPSVAGILTPAFLNALAACSASSQIFTIQLKNANSPGVSLGISDDGTVQTITGAVGATYQGQPGTASLVGTISGVGPATFTYSTTSSPITSWAAAVMTFTDPTYNVFGIAWAPSQTVAIPALSPFAAILLAAGLCAAAMYLIRKRKAGFNTKS